ncbi:MAG: hypothetical protein K5640_02845 [Treponema sp.]|nr:hypothetical protein [Treponema sp.]
MNNFFYYLLFSSAILFYGLGIERIITVQKNYKILVLNYLKSLCAVCITVIISAFFTQTVLNHFMIAQLYPFFTLIVFIFVSLLINFIIYKAIKEVAFDFSTSFLFALLAVHESSNFLESIVISVACVTAYYFVQVLLISFKKHFDFYKQPEKIHTVSLLYINIAVLIFSLFAWNISWLNPAGLQ